MSGQQFRNRVHGRLCKRTLGFAIALLFGLSLVACSQPTPSNDLYNKLVEIRSERLKLWNTPEQEAGVELQIFQTVSVRLLRRKNLIVRSMKSAKNIFPISALDIASFTPNLMRSGQSRSVLASSSRIISMSCCLKAGRVTRALD